MTITSLQLTLKIAKQMLTDLDTPTSLAIYILLKDGSDEAWDQIFDFSFNPLNYTEEDVDKARRDLCAVSLLSKVPNFLERDLDLAAITKFQDGEDECKRMNDWINRNWNDPDIVRVSDTLLSILGNCPSLDFCFSSSDFGPGSSFCLSRDKASPDLKACFSDTATIACARALTNCKWPIDMEPRSLKLVPGNLVSTAPKNAKTGRTIAIEASFNSRCQKGIGNDIRAKLLRLGIDLNDQSYNQQAAMTAIRLGRATIDLRNASGSICRALVHRGLENSPWLDLLSSCRSDRYTLDTRSNALNGKAEYVEYESWSSMGNGYTFELESAIFLSICLAAGVELGEALIYGDDIIVPQEKAHDVVRLLEKCGFSLNSDKSFLSGLFFESCGAYSFNGVDITPVKIKDLAYDLPHVLVLANKLRAFSALDRFFTLDRRYLPTYRLCVDAARDQCFMSLLCADRKKTKRAGKPPSPKRLIKRKAAEMLRSLRGPIGVGGCLHSSLSECAPRYSKKRGGLLFNTVSYRVRERFSEVNALYYRREASVKGNWHESCTGSGFQFMGHQGPGNVVKELVTKSTQLCCSSTERWSNALDW